jgi:signal transduction histidine kinase/CheY-like chemotaxis protein/ligand-binding sensor domain-containing protein/AraC-like DNA-binding protein
VYDEEKDDFTQLVIDQAHVGNDSINRVFRILEDNLGNYWLGSWEGGIVKTRISNYETVEVLQFYSMQSEKHFRISSNITYALYKDRKGAIWVGTPYGLNIITDHQTPEPQIHIFQSGSDIQNVSQNDVFHIDEDRQGNIWLATGGGGLNMINPDFRFVDSFSIPEMPEQSENQIIRSFTMIKDSVLLVGLNGLGFGEYKLNEHDFVPYHKMEIFSQMPEDLNAATRFMIDRSGNLWIGTRYNGLFVVNLQTSEVTHLLYDDPVTSDRSRLINDLFEDQFGYIWVGTSNGLFKFTGNSQQGYEVYRYLPDPLDENSLRSDFISVVFEDSDSQLWVGSIGGGLSMVKNEPGMSGPLSFTHFHRSNQHKTSYLKSNIIYSVREDKNRRLWIGTGTAGVAIYDLNTGVFNHLSRDQGLRDETVYDIILDDHKIWFTTNKGIYMFDTNNGLEQQLEVFTSDDGFPSDVFINNASYRSTDGRLFVGGYHGFNIFKSEELFRNSYIPSLVITGIWVADEPVNVYDVLQNGLHLKHNQNNIRVAVSSLSFFQPQKNRYAILLEGLDKSWKRVNYEGRIVSYSHIPPGNYTLRLNGSNSSGVWSDNPIALQIRVKPHPLNSNLARIIYVLATITMVVGVYRFLLKNYKIQHAFEIEKIQRKKDEKINQFKFRFFTNISHELLTPLSVLSYLVDDLSHRKALDEETFSVMNRNVKRIMHLITQLLDFRKVESGSMRPLVSPINPREFIDKMSKSLKPLADKKDIKVYLKGNIDHTIYFDLDKIEKILCNLLSNAIKYTPEKGKIIIGYKTYIEDNTEWLKLEVTDSGKGIEPSKIDKVFERFYQVKSVTGSTFGVGIGLALAKSLVENHKGFIQVQNVEQMGARFTVNIPVSLNAFDEDEVLMDEADCKESSFISCTDVSAQSQKAGPENELQSNRTDNKKTVLVVDDNHDFRSLLKGHMANYYNTLEAENGQEAFDICLEKQPDIIITDMMMPVMDGIELCTKIKTTIETSHIIVILLTAKINEDARYESYLANVDSFIPKPADMRVLYTRVESLLSRFDDLKTKFAAGVLPSPGENGISTLDDEFLNKIRSVIESSYTDPELNVVTFSQEMGMSKSNLYRKITRLTGMSPVEFIRYIRLQSAARLITSEGLNVSEAAYSVGFNDLSYFSKSFKNQFGLSPKKYQQLHQ